MSKKFDMYHIGNIHTSADGGVTVRATRDLVDEDWKTAMAHNQGPMRVGTIGKVIGVVDNYYGTFLHVEDEHGERRYLNGFGLEMVRG